MKLLKANALVLVAAAWCGHSWGQEAVSSEPARTANDPFAALSFTYLTCVRIMSEKYASTNATATEISEAAAFKCESNASTFESEVYREVRESNAPDTARAISKRAADKLRSSARGTSVSAVLDKRSEKK